MIVNIGTTRNVALKNFECIGKVRLHPANFQLQTVRFPEKRQKISIMLAELYILNVFLP